MSLVWCFSKFLKGFVYKPSGEEETPSHFFLSFCLTLYMLLSGLPCLTTCTLPFTANIIFSVTAMVTAPPPTYLPPLPSLPQPVTLDHWAPLHYGSWSSLCICCIHPQTEADLAANYTTIGLLLFNRQNTTYWHNVLRVKIAERLQCLKMEVNLVRNLRYSIIKALLSWKGIPMKKEYFSLFLLQLVSGIIIVLGLNDLVAEFQLL